MPLVPVNDITMYYESHGAGDPLVVIGGLGLGVSELQPLIAALAADHEVIAVDNRGSGRSSKPPGPYTIEQMAADVAALLRCLGLSRAHVLGISMGGRIAMSLALDHPEIVDRLVLVSTGPRVAGHRRRVQLGMAISRLPVLRGRNSPPLHAIKAQFAASSRFDCTSRLDQITQPTLVVHGRSDHVAPLKLAKQFRDSVPGARLVLLDGGHLIALAGAHRDHLAAQVRDFCEPMADADDRAPITRMKDGRRWRIGGATEVAWIAAGTAPGLTITSAVPPVFDAYATVVVPDDGEPRTQHEKALLALLGNESPDQPWWLGFLDTGSADVVFPDAPTVTLYTGWRYVLVEAGPQQAAGWRAPVSGRGGLPDLIFPADRAWLVATLWDDDWHCVGGSAGLIERLTRDERLEARAVGFGDDATPPGHQAI